MDHLNIVCTNTLAQGVGPVGVQLDCNNRSLGISICDSPSLAARSRATIEDAQPLADQRRDQLRRFILDRDPSFRICLGFC